ncbi:hypothetical protein ACFL1O_00355 [Patescibacteria group bacterium]
MPKKIICIFLLTLFTLSCSRALPSSKTIIKSPWTNYNDTKKVYEKIIPNKTTIEDLKKLGIDPYKTPNIRILTFREILKIYLPNSSVKKEDLDTGVQTCLKEKNGCISFALNPQGYDEKRVGNFWKDQFKFKRKIIKSGWRFSGLILIVGNIVVYKEEPGGKPNIVEEKTEKNPLGPIQNFGEIIGDGVRNLY